MAPTETEITSDVDLCRQDGTLNPAAIGWTRHPLHTANLRGWGRTKRWEYWCVQSPTHVLALTVSSIDYLALHTVWFLEYGGPEIDKTVIAPLSRMPVFPERSGAGPVSVAARGVGIWLEPQDGGIRLRARTDRVEADVTVSRPPGHEGMGVVIPWSDRRFQYTVKDNTLPARGVVVADGREFVFDPVDSWAMLDHGRGRWPYNTTWNWGSASGQTDEHVVGLQFGGKWTDGTGMTENALCVDGRVHKISEDLVWEYDTADWTAPWRVRTAASDAVDVELTPIHERRARTEALLISTEVHQCFGTWNGRIAPPGTGPIRIESVRGFAEQARMRW